MSTSSPGSRGTGGISDRVFGAVAVLVGLGYAFQASRIPTGFLVDPLGPKAFPVAVGLIGALLGLLIALKPDRPGPSWPSLASCGALAIALVTLIAYAYSLKPSGFLIPTALASAILSYQIRPRALAAVLTGLGLSLGLFLIFRFLLGLSLAPVPRGWLG